MKKLNTIKIARQRFCQDVSFMDRRSVYGASCGCDPMLRNPCSDELVEPGSEFSDFVDELTGKTSLDD